MHFALPQIAIQILDEGRIGIAAQMVGLAQGAFDKSVEYAYQRVQFGKPVGEQQGMAHQFAKVSRSLYQGLVRSAQH